MAKVSIPEREKCSGQAAVTMNRVKRMEDLHAMALRHQNTMWAIRREMGWPPFAPANASIAFVSGRPFDIEVGMDLVRHSQTMGKDIIYSGWASARDEEPASIILVVRELLTVDVIDRCHMWAADEEAPLLIVAPHIDEHFAIGVRGLLERRPGKPKNLHAGRKRAMNRIRAAAAAMGDEICPQNVWVPNGAIAQPSAPHDAVARFL